MSIIADQKRLKFSGRGFIDFRSLFRHYIVNDETDHYKVVSVKLLVHANHNYNVRWNRFVRILIESKLNEEIVFKVINSSVVILQQRYFNEVV